MEGDGDVFPHARKPGLVSQSGMNCQATTDSSSAAAGSSRHRQKIAAIPASASILPLALD
jgi:hypothetical protein